MTYYIVYETTNLINNKKYRGAHVCEDLDDGYLGSGYNIRIALRKYGRQNFERHILFMAFDYAGMWYAESVLVDTEWVSRVDTYNISLGGRGSKVYGRKMSDTTKAKLAAAMAPYYADPKYREKLSQSQKNKAPPTDQARANMSKAGKGKQKSQEARKNISAGMQKYLQCPEVRKKRSEQSKISNARPEVKAKIKKALTGRIISDETKRKFKIAAKTRCQDPTYIQKQSISQSGRWETYPATWWNNGVSSKRSVLCPGPEWLPGRITFGTW